VVRFLVIILFVLLLSGCTGATLNTTPSPEITNPPAPTPAPIEIKLDNTVWELHELFADGVTSDRELLKKAGALTTFWFHSNGDFTGVYDNEYITGTWSLSGEEMFLTVAGETQTLYVLPDGNSFKWIEDDVGTMLFVRNDSISFNPPAGENTAPPVSNINWEDSFLRGSWAASSATWLYHFGKSEIVVFLPDGTVLSTEDEYFVDGEYGKICRWYIIDDNTIIITDELETNQFIFTVTLSSDVLTITDSTGDSSQYIRQSNDSPFGMWALDDYYRWIYYFGLSETVRFNVYGNVWASEPDIWAHWWFPPDRDNDNIFAVRNIETGREWFFTYNIFENGKYMVITDADGDWIQLERIG